MEKRKSDFNEALEMLLYRCCLRELAKDKGCGFRKSEPVRFTEQTKQEKAAGEQVAVSMAVRRKQNIAAMRSSEQNNSCSAGVAPKTVYEILCEKMGVNIADELGRYVSQKPENLWQYDIFKGMRNFTVNSCCHIDSIIPAIQDLDNITAAFILSARVSANIGEQDEVTDYALSVANAKGIVRETVYFALKATLDLRPCEQVCTGFEFHTIAQSHVRESTDEFGRVRTDRLMDKSGYFLLANEYLIPIMRQESYEKVSHLILKGYYQEALESGERVDGRMLAKRMGLKIFDAQLRPQVRSYGMMIFSPTFLDVWSEEKRQYVSVRILPGTIVINTTLCKNAIQVNSTVTHECIHFFLHKLFYMLQLAADPAWSFCAHRTAYRTKSEKLTPIDWAELQAQKMPAYILMPAETAQKTAGVYILHCLTYEDVDVYDCKIVRSLIEYMAQYYGVSFSMAKYRLIELGYPEAEGIGEYVNDKRVPDHRCTYKWPKGVTYTIDMSSAAKLAVADKRFAEIIKGDGYRYIDGHFCLNSSKYITRGYDGRYQLTDYARTHIDECCLAFHVYGRSGGTQYSSSFAAKNQRENINGKYRPKHELVGLPESRQGESKTENFSEKSRFWYDIKSNLPYTLIDSIKFIISACGVSQMELGLMMDRDRTTVMGWYNSSRPKLRHIVAFCIVMNAPMEICRILVQKGGTAFTDSYDDFILLMLAQSAETETLESCNSRLQKENMMPLI